MGTKKRKNKRSKKYNMMNLQKLSAQTIADNIRGNNFQDKVINVEKINISSQLKRKIIKKLKKNEIKYFIEAKTDDELGLIMEFYINRNDINTVEIFLEYYPDYVDIYNTTYFEQTPLYNATEFDYYEMSELLLQNDANPDAKDFEDGITPLMNTCYNKNKKISKLLLEYDADPNIQDDKGQTALFIAISKNDIKMVKLLLEYDADPNIRRRIQNSKTTLEAARDKKEILELLLEYGATE